MYAYDIMIIPYTCIHPIYIYIHTCRMYTYDIMVSPYISIHPIYVYIHTCRMYTYDIMITPYICIHTHTSAGAHRTCKELTHLR